MNTGWLTAVAAAIPPLAGVAAKIYLASSDSRLVHKIEQDIALHDIAPERSKDILEKLVFAETLAHAQRRLNKANRKIMNRPGSAGGSIYWIATSGWSLR